MGILKKCMISSSQAVVTCVEGRDIVNEAIERHGLSALPAAALGRTMLGTVIMASGIKSGTVGVSFHGDGAIGPVIVECGGDLRVRGYVGNPSAELPYTQAGKLDVGGGVGKNGFMKVVKDLGLKSPFTATVKIYSGEIAEDFAYYYATSEQTPSVVALGVLIGKDGKCISAGGITVEVLPFCEEALLDELTEKSSHMGRISEDFLTMTPEQVIMKYFGDDNPIFTEERTASFGCRCSRQTVEGVVTALGIDELEQIMQEDGKASVTCHFCGSTYDFFPDFLKKLKNKTDKAKKGGNK